ncbi:pyrroline-5-carboxylate reductase [Paenibacillus radicis (ex Xue et al. 2023)]|uniref:Pyrroline-5-carboxylate reductase n=1 Tax=Paenibacillus radicis (ex Xue et al. 2023) TaxID=2972489 RepID=A0ABT1YP23_9BACL|nr:pyrroline-5-carboxylate reductase [Paenibacillus radicis (ex Xue et al. 2023)]MCR8634924.1 pyrroline-5-carboxylate reductase [Paenibacillus radicis (ex Xue et al. 2023)]
MSLTLSNAAITFVGAGSMAEAIVRGLTSQQDGNPSRITMLNRQDVSRLQSLQQRYGVSYAVESSEKDQSITAADVVIVAFKPKDAVEGLKALSPLLQPSQLLVSVIAGLSTSTIEDIIGAPGQPIARTMPNTSSSIGFGATGISFTASVTADQQKLATDMFSSTGIVSVVEEASLDIVTGVSGSGPAYIYYMMEAMIEGGIRGGLTPEAAKQLTVQTVLGAARMVELTGEDPADLRRKVTSPNGTTQAALETLDRHDFSSGVTKAVLRSAERAGELGQAISAQAANR